MVDLKNGDFGSSLLEASDFQSGATATYGSIKPPLSGGWYTFNLISASSNINLFGNTQIRLRFKKDDNDNLIANYLKLYSGNAGVDAPQLVIEYYVP